MKKFLSVILLCLFVSVVWAQNGDVYDPVNPADPDVYYKLMVEASPKKGGKVYSSAEQIPAGSAGAGISCDATANAGYKFKHWMVGDKVVSTESSFWYSMPKENTVLVAYFDWVGNDGYDPQNPEDPFVEGYQHKVTLYATPSVGGSFNSGSFYLTEGETANVYAYPNSGYRFVSWKQNGKIISTNNPMEITMDSVPLEFTAQFVYDPQSPSNPGANNFNATTGELIIDDFETGMLSSAIFTTLASDDNYTKGKNITIIGAMQPGDFGFLNRMTNCSVVDLSRTTGYSEVPDYAFEGAVALKTLVLPYSVERIGIQAFCGCTSLSTLYCYATTPPTITKTTFDKNTSSIKVLVPAMSLELYQNAEYWKNFKMSALDGVTNTLTISLPEDAKDGRYKNMILELDNITSGQIKRMLITNRTRYSFVNLIHNTKYNVYVKTAQSVVLGELQNIEIVDKDVIKAFAQLKQPQAVTISVVNQKGEDLTESTDITWLDEGGNYLTTGNSISGYVEGSVLQYRIKLLNDAVLYYVTPKDSMYVVKARNNKIAHVLNPLQLISVKGYVKNANTKRGVYDASVSISQNTSGRQSRTVVAKTDKNGMFTAEVYNSPARITLSAFDYANKTIDIDSFTTAGGNATVSDIMLNSIVGATINVNLTYQPSVLEGDSPVVQNWYNDYMNVALSVYNLTTRKEISQISNRYPQFVVMDGVKVGDELKMTLSSKKSAFEPVVIEKKVGETEEINAIFAIKQYGGMQASYQTTTNDAVVGIVYDKNGYLQQKSGFANDNTLLFSGLKDGDYTLVAMGKNDTYNSIYNISRLRDAGLTENVDYSKSNFTVESGVIKKINISNVPFLNIAKFQTINNEKSSLSVNKSSVVAGNCLTFTGVVELQDKNTTIIDKLSLVVDIPSSASFVKGSVMVGDKVVDNYTFSDNILTIPLNNVGLQNKVKFCVIPTEEGSYQPNAMVGLNANGENVMIPIGAATYSVQNTSVEVANRTNTESVIISGTAAANAMVEVYDNDILIGSVLSNASGTWSGRFELKDAYNLSKHDIYAQITIGDVCITTNHTECQMFTNDIVVNTIKMSHYNEYKRATETIIIDYQNQRANKKSYDFYHTALFTFNVDFNRNDTACIDNVIVIVWNSKGESTRLTATYSPTSKNWVATGTFNSLNLPSSLDVEYEIFNIPVFPDRAQINLNWKSIDVAGVEIKTDLEYIQESLSDTEEFLKADSLFDNLDVLLSQNDVNTELLGQLLTQVIDTTLCYQVNDEDLNNRIQDFFINYNEDEDLLNSIVGDYFNLEFLNYSATDFGDVDYLVKLYSTNPSSNYAVEKITSINDVELYNAGYNKLPFSDSTCVFFKYTDDEVIFIDPSRNFKITLCESERTEQSRVKDLPMKVITHRPDLWANCLSSIKFYVNRLKELKNEHSSDIRQNLSETGQALKDLADAVSCFYVNALKDVKSSLEERYNEKKKITQEVYDENIKLRDDISARINSSNNEIKRLQFENSLADPVKDAQRIKDNNNIIKELTASIKSDKKFLKTLNISIARQTKKLDGFKKWYESCTKKLYKLPATVSRGAKVSKAISSIGKLAGPFGVLVEAYCLYVDIDEASTEIQEWGELINAIDAKRPCNGSKEELEKIYDDCIKDGEHVSELIFSCIIAEGIALGTDIGSVFIPDPIGLFAEWLFSGILNGYAEIFKNFTVYSKYVEKRGNYYVKLMKLKCFCECDINGNGCKCPKGTCICIRCCKKCKCKTGEKCTCKRSCKCSPRKPDFKGQLDPSGYVYEGIFDNRVEGVTATCYKKIQVEDMYGDLHDKVLKWDADEYGQENPLYTDKDGFYQWFVPEGLWQVKFEKEGYETAYSEWLPVPPPQLDVNIGIVQNRQPKIKDAHAYEDGIEFTFDKYMMPAYLTVDNIKVSQNGKVVDGKVVLVDEEVAYRNENVKYASIVRFVPNAAFSADKEVTLIVANRVKSYADIPMAETFTQDFDIEKEVKSLSVDSLIKVSYQKTKVITVSAKPSDAVAGKVMHAESSSEMLATVVQKDITIDRNGNATFVIRGDLPGTAGITFTVPGTKVVANSVVNIEQEVVQPLVSKPTASLESGASVYGGTRVELSASDKGYKIWYTTDGTCPCDENGSRKLYSAAIAINSDMTIKAITENADGEASEVATFVYSILRSTDGVSLSKGWNWISFNMEMEAQPNSNTMLASGQWTSNNIIKNQQYFDMYSSETKKWIGTLSKHECLNNTQMYKIHSSQTQHLGLIGKATNPADVKIAVDAGWNYIGYTPLVDMDVTEALKNYMAHDGDVIKSQDAFAVYTTRNGWEGDLMSLAPGHGYMLKRSLGAGKTSFCYPSDVGGASAKVNTVGAKCHPYAENMNIVGEISDIDIQEGDSVVALVNGELRGFGMVDEHQKVYLTIHGDEDANVILALQRDGNIVATANEMVGYQSNTVIGTPDSPTAIRFSSTTDNEDFIGTVRSIYSATGIKMKTTEKEKLPVGIYVIYSESNGKTCVTKYIRK